jgi:quinolinate synthase
VASIAFIICQYGNVILNYTTLNLQSCKQAHPMTLVQPMYLDQINSLKKELHAIILAHNYQIPEVQDIADFIGDSLALSREAAKTDADIIVFCGVHFMAETASILCPEKTVLIPDLDAGCSLASTINSYELQKWKKEHPHAVVVSYVNTSAEVKALSDYCCTSSNAVKVVNSIPKDTEILFLPDMFLGSYVGQVTGRKNLYVWPGECHVHAGITTDDINNIFRKYNHAEFMVHPECGCTSSMLYGMACGDITKKAHILSTEGMMQHAKNSDSSQFVVATETGILYRMKKENPDKMFIPVNENAVCKYMKKITLEKVVDSLVHKQYEVKVPKHLADSARTAIERMLKIS